MVIIHAHSVEKVIAVVIQCPDIRSHAQALIKGNIFVAFVHFVVIEVTTSNVMFPCNTELKVYLINNKFNCSKIVMVVDPVNYLYFSSHL